MKVFADDDAPRVREVANLLNALSSDDPLGQWLLTCAAERILDLVPERVRGDTSRDPSSII